MESKNRQWIPGSFYAMVFGQCEQHFFRAMASLHDCLDEVYCCHLGLLADLYIKKQGEAMSVTSHVVGYVHTLQIRTQQVHASFVASTISCVFEF